MHYQEQVEIIDYFIQTLDELEITIAEKINSKNVPGVLSDDDLDTFTKIMIRGLKSEKESK